MLSAVWRQNLVEKKHRHLLLDYEQEGNGE